MFIDGSEAEIIPSSIEQLADSRRREGRRVIAHKGCYWEEITPGFYEPVNLLTRLNLEQAVPPPQFRWGYRAVLADGYASSANGSLPVHLLTDVKYYDTHKLSSNRRTHLRKCRKEVKNVVLTKAATLREQGYEVITSSLKRTKHKKIPTRDDYIKSVEATNFDNHLVIAGVIDGKLGGYLLGYAVENTAYIASLFVKTEILATNITTGLVFDFVQACRRSGKISEVVYGLHSREAFSLCRFKEGLGFPVKHIPTRVSVNLAIGKIIRWLWPHKYYRLTGRE